MLLSSGQACSYPMKGTHAKYGCFAYSSAFGYSVPPGLFTLEQYALASQLGLSDDGGEYWKTRRLTSYAAIEKRGDGDVIVSVWAPFPDVSVRTTLVPPDPAASPNWHLRVHQITVAPAKGDARAIMTADGAFAVHNENARDGRYLDLYDAAAGEGTHPKIIGNYDTLTPAGWARGREGAFAVCRDAGAVGIRALERGIDREANLVNADPNSNLVHSRTVIPTLQHTLHSGQTAWYVTAVYAKPAGRGVAAESFLDGWEAPPALPAWLQAEVAEGG